MSGRLASWYRRLDSPDRMSLSNIVYGALSVVLGVWIALYYDTAWGWLWAGFALLVLVGNSVNDLVLLALYRQTYRNPRGRQ